LVFLVSAAGAALKHGATSRAVGRITETTTTTVAVIV
jgi:hypothetical protein